MTKPTTVVSFSNSSDIDGNAIWNDISTYVLSVEINRGKSSDLDSYSSGTLTVTLNNRSRAFEPNYASSPYYGLIEPMGQIKVVTASYTQFVGIIDAWTFDYSEKGLFSTAQIRANDNLAVIAKNTLSANTFSPQISGSRIRSILYGTDVYYTQPSCIDSGTRTITSDTVAEGAGALDYLQKVAANDGGLFFARRDGILAYQDTTLSNAAALPTYRYNYACNSSFETAISGFWTGGVRSTSWAYKGTYSLTTAAFEYEFYYDETSSSKYKKDLPYNVSFYIKGGTSTREVKFTAYMTLAGVPIRVGNDYVSISKTVTINPSEVSRINLGSIKTSSNADGIQVWASLTSQSPVANAFYMDALLIEPTTKLQPYFDGSSTTSAPSGQTYSFSFQGTTHNSTSIMQTDVSNLVDFTTITNIADNNYSGIKFNDLSMVYGSEKLYNLITLNGSTYQSSAIDLVSQSKYGIKEYAVTDAILDNQADNDSLAAFLLSLFKSPDFRAESISLTLHNLNTSDQNTILAMDMLSQINLKFKPGNTGASLSANYQVIGINQSISPEEHIVELRVTSLDNFGFVLDNPVLGILDTNRLV